MLYVLWAALLVWLGARLREQCGLERVALLLQLSVVFGGCLVAITGFIPYYQIDWAGVRLISGTAMHVLSRAGGQGNHCATDLGDVRGTPCTRSRIRRVRMESARARRELRRAQPGDGNPRPQRVAGAARRDGTAGRTLRGGAARAVVAGVSLVQAGPGHQLDI